MQEIQKDDGWLRKIPFSSYINTSILVVNYYRSSKALNLTALRKLGKAKLLVWDESR